MKVDFKKELKELYNPESGAFSLVKVPKLQYLMVDGQGDPNKVVEYQEAVQALFSVSYTLKFHSKNELGKDYVVPPLEGLWWSDNFDDFRSRRKNKWSWTMMIMVPEWLGKKEFDAAVSTVKSKRPEIKVERLRLESLEEGLSVQIMHIGSYDDETPTLLKLHDEWIPANGYIETLRHHEVYLGDPRKTPAAKLKTVLRQPVEKLK